ncbi:MAG TPA: dockerin type I domain-containing protein [Armatimonadota bacterium]|jgi:hypothetical protein
MRVAAAVLMMGAALLRGPQARADVDLFRANLHSHTAASDGDVFGAGGPTAASLTTAAAAAKGAGLTCFATSDHGEYLTSSVYQSIISQSRAATTPGPSNQPGTMIALWGFEWTNAASYTTVKVAQGAGHLSVYGASDRAGAADRGGGWTEATNTKAIWWHNYGPGPTTTQSLWQWVLDHSVSPLGGTVVVQINHPNLYPGCALADPCMWWYDNWWRKLEWVPVMDPYVTLMEMSSRSEPGTTAGFYGAKYNEPYFQLALDNGWHLGPTNGEDNHSDRYGSLRSPDGILTDTGIWATFIQYLSPASAQASMLGALRARRVFSSEDKVTDPINPHAKAISLKFTVSAVSRGLRWMGSRDFDPADVQNNRCRLEISRGAGLLLDNTSVQVITNRGAVVKTLPLSKATVTGNTAVWNFSLLGDQPAAQLRASNITTPYTSTQFDAPPIPAPQGTAPATLWFDATGSGRIERYYYIRVQQTDGTVSFTAPIWMHRDFQVAGGTDGYHAPRAANVVSYKWDFGDGVVETEANSDANAPDGQFDGQTKHVYTTPGEYYPRVTVTYANGTQDVSITRVWIGAGAPATPLYGDVNGDGQINAEDVACLSRVVAGLAPSDSAQLTRADVFPPAAADPVKHLPGDKQLTILDVLRLQRFLAGTIKTWP